MSAAGLMRMEARRLRQLALTVDDEVVIQEARRLAGELDRLADQRDGDPESADDKAGQDPVGPPRD